MAAGTHLQPRGIMFHDPALLKRPLAEPRWNQPRLPDRCFFRPQKARPKHRREREGNDAGNHDPPGSAVTANSWNMRPINRPLMNRSGMNTATSEVLMETTVKPIWRAPFKAAWKRLGLSPCSTNRNTFSITTIASSTTKPTEMGDGHQRQIVHAVMQQIHRPKRPRQRQRHSGNR